MTIKTWLRVNRLTLALIGGLFLAEVALLLRVGPGGGQYVYWWMIAPGLFCGPVVILAIIAIVMTFRSRPRSWYLRAVFGLPFIVSLPLGLLASFHVSPFFARNEHVTSGSFHGHVYYLSFDAAPPLSGEFYRYYTLHECDSIGVWCHWIDTYSDYEDIPLDKVIAADPVNDTLYVVSVNPIDGSRRITREYVPINPLSQGRNPP